MPPDDLHMPYEDAFRALRAERDMWARVATEQLQYIRQLEQQLIDQQNQIQAMSKAEDVTTKLPQENDSPTLVQWLEAEKTLGNDYYTDAGFNRSKMCRNLLKIIGWEPNQDSLRKAQSR